MELSFLADSRRGVAFGKVLYVHSYVFANPCKIMYFVAVLVLRVKMFFCRKLANTRPTNELNVFFAFAERLPTSVNLDRGHPCQLGKAPKTFFTLLFVVGG